MKIESVEFVRSAAGASDLPCDRLPELAMVGRSNVGKSSLINSLVRSAVARTSAAPGKTRLINLYRVVMRPTGPFYLVDLPGYGYTRKKDAREEFDRLATVYFARAAGPVGISPKVRPSTGPSSAARGALSNVEGRKSESPKVGSFDSRTLGPSDSRTGSSVSIGVLLLVDARHPGLESDLATVAWLRDRGFDPLVAVTKLDKLSKSERTISLRAFEQSFGVTARTRDAGPRVFGHAVVGVSAATGEGMDELWKQVASWIAAETASSQPPLRP